MSLTLTDKVVLALQKVNQISTAKVIISTLNQLIKHNLTCTDICILRKRHPDILIALKGEKREHYYGLKKWLDENGKLIERYRGEEFHILQKKEKIKVVVKYLPMSTREDMLGQVTFTKKTFNPNSLYNNTWITSNKIIFLLFHYQSLSIQKMVELILLNEPFQLTMNTYYLTIY